MSKHNKKTKGCLGIWVAGASLLISSSVHAGIPVWTYSAPSPASVVVSDGGTATVQYTVTNQSRKAKNLILRATPGLSASSCHLAGKGSTCSLTLSINGSLIPQQGIHAGPVLCEQSNPNQCYQPSQANSLDVRVVPTPQAAISVTPSNITLTTDSGNSATVTVTNNGVVDAYNVSTTLATPNHGVMVNSTTCGSVLGYSPPNNTCTITFEMGAGGSAGTTNATIKGDNSNVSSVAISVVSPVAPVLSINSPAQPDRVIPVNNGSLDIVVVSSNPLATSNTDITASLPPAWGSAVTASYTDCTDVVPGGSCTIHLQATAPFVADQITINGTNGASPLTTYVAFRAGGGLVFSVNGGVTKVVTEANISSGIIWGGYGYEVGGINQNSTVSGGDPCDGKNDGGCNTTRIINCLTNQDNCVNTPSSSIDIATYAAGICDQYNGGTFNDWYLPAICEWSNSGNSCSIDNIYTNLRQHGFGGIVVGAYWSSTEVSTLPQDFAWYQLFAASGNSFQGGSTKSSQPGVRCVRGF